MASRVEFVRRILHPPKRIDVDNKTVKAATLGEKLVKLLRYIYMYAHTN